MCVICLVSNPCQHLSHVSQTSKIHKWFFKIYNKSCSVPTPANSNCLKNAVIVTKQWNFACYNLNNSVLWQNSNVKMEGNSLFSFTLTRLDCQSCSCFVLLMPQAGQVNKGEVPAADKSWMVLGLRALFNSDSTHLFPEKEQCSNFNGYWRWFWWGVILFVCLFVFIERGKKILIKRMFWF